MFCIQFLSEIFIIKDICLMFCFVFSFLIHID